MSVSYENIYSDEIVESFVTNLNSEFGGSANVYYGDSFQKKSNKSIKVSVLKQSHNEVNDDMFLNSYEIEIKYYVILGNISQIGYKTFFYDMHRVEQIMLALQATSDFLNFKINSISINNYEEDEENVNGLYLATFLVSFSMLKG